MTEELKIKRSPLSTFGPIAAALLVGLLVARPADQLLSEYRGVLMRHEGDRTWVFTKNQGMLRLSTIEAEPGVMLEKQSGRWHPEVVPATGFDAKLQKSFRRYTESYTGTITRIIDPRVEGGAYTAVIDTDVGDTLHRQLWDKGLAGAHDGARLKKEAGMWEPYLLDPSDPDYVKSAAIQHKDASGTQEKDKVVSHIE